MYKVFGYWLWLYWYCVKDVVKKTPLEAVVHILSIQVKFDISKDIFFSLWAVLVCHLNDESHLRSIRACLSTLIKFYVGDSI